MASCSACGAQYEVSAQDTRFYEEMSPTFDGKRYQIPAPRCCPACRLQRRLAFRNQIYVYSRPSAATGKSIFSMFPENTSFPVFENEIWWSDSWDGLDYGREFDFSQPFFPQLIALRDTVPHYALSLVNPENSGYCNNSRGLKNCYLVFNTSFAHDCMYCENSTSSIDCIDCTRTPNCELCSHCTECARCYNVHSSQFCEDCLDGTFLFNCRSCRHCFCCANLRRKEYCIFNKQYSASEYQALLASANLGSYRTRKQTEDKWTTFVLQQPVPHLVQRRAENVNGNYLFECRNVHDSYFIRNAEDIRFGFNLDEESRTCYDFSFLGKQSEKIYECVDCGIDAFGLSFCFGCWGSVSNLLYCMRCNGCDSCFGCVGLKKKRYCIFNRQYTASDYKLQSAKIIEHMQRTNEWGEFFPACSSTAPYNHSIAMRYFPLSSAEAKKQGFAWLEQESAGKGAIAAADIPDTLPETDASLVVKSEASGKAFKITAKEITLYRKLGVPLPRLTYDERMEQRAKKLGGIKLYSRQCARTGKRLLSTFPPDSPWIVWDREDYEAEYGR